MFEAGTFVPAAKIQDGKQYSIVSDYLGTPIQMYDGQGNKTWDCTLDIYGKVLAVDKGTEFDCSFRLQGQYADEETGLYYNRFRYYDADLGGYISQDPIGLAGGNPTLYAFVCNTNYWIDLFGLFIVFRNLPIGSTISGGLKARLPGRDMSLTGHIRNGSKPNFRGSQFISVTTDPNVALKWKEKGQITIMFDTEDVIPDGLGNKNIFDVSTRESAISNKVTSEIAIRYANSSKEVLIEGFVPENKIKIVSKNDLITISKEKLH